MICDGINAAGVLAPNFSNRLGGGRCAHPPGQFVIEPLTGFFWPAPSAPELANEITGNAKIALFAL
jgi:hypothetical protein